jgi:hypothetical protein
MSGTRTGVREQHGRTATGCEDPRASGKHIFTKTYISPTFCWSAGLNRPSEPLLVAHDCSEKARTRRDRPGYSSANSSAVREPLVAHLDESRMRHGVGLSRHDSALDSMCRDNGWEGDGGASRVRDVAGADNASRKYHLRHRCVQTAHRSDELWRDTRYQHASKTGGDHAVEGLSVRSL